MPGVYVTGQLGYAQTDLKDKMKAFNSFFNSPTDLVQVSGKNNIDNNGLAGRLAIGYQFNCNFAVEMGYLQMKQVETGTFSFFHDPSEKAPFAKINLTANQHAFDIAAKGILPLANNFNVYGKLGVAYLNSTINLKGEETEDGSSQKINIDETVQESKFAPEIVVGVSYAITPNVSLDTSLTHIHNFGKNSAGNVNFFAAGISYNFG